MAAQESLEDREELLRRLIEDMPDGLLQLDDSRELVFHNARLLTILHGAVDDRRALTLDMLLAPLTRTGRIDFDAAVTRTLKDGASEEVELEVATAAGAPRYVLIKARPLKRQNGVVSGAIISVLDVTDGVRARHELEKRATSDSLTGSHNRSSIIATLKHELATGSQIGVLYVDLDRFKVVNDTLGHAAGDEALALVADRMRGVLRASDELGRLGGDEFLVVLRGVSDVAVAMEAATRVSEALRGSVELASGNVDLCASVGAAYVNDAPVSAEALIQRADAAMYRSKRRRHGVPVLAGAV